jgi:hypothetical protein
MVDDVIFTPSEADFVRAQRDYWRSRTRGSRGLRLFLIFPVLFAVMGAIDSMSGEASLVWNLVGYAICGAIAGGLAWVALLVIMPFRARRTFRQQRNLHKEFQYGWSEDGLRYRSKYGSGIIPWHELHRWSDERHTFLFYVHDKLFHFLPHRVLTAEQAQDLRSTAARFGPERR